MKFGFFFQKNEKNNNYHTIQSIRSIPDLPTDIQDLMLQAGSFEKCLCPYSKFRVGVAIFR
jgi:hypothetical protein